MIALTAPIACPNLNRMEVASVSVRGKQGIAYVAVEVIGVGARQPRYPHASNAYALSIRNGPCQGLRATADPDGYLDRVEVFTTTLPTGFTDLVTEYRTGAGEATGRTRVETWLVAQGLLPAGTVS